MSQSDDKIASKIAITENSEELDDEKIEFSSKEEINILRKIDGEVRKYPELIAIFISVISLIILATLSHTQWAGLIEAERITLAELEDFENRVVTVEATVIDSYEPTPNIWIIDIDDGSTEERRVIFVSNLNFIPKSGDVLEATGESQEYKGTWEVICDPKDIKIISKWDKNEITIGDLANDPNFYVGKNIVISGYVKETPSESYNRTTMIFGDTYHSLRIETTTIDIPVLLEGDRIEVKGLVEFDTYWYSYQILLDSETHEVKILDD